MTFDPAAGMFQLQEVTSHKLHVLVSVYQANISQARVANPGCTEHVVQLITSKLPTCSILQ